jgi:hypothetical protein
MRNSRILALVPAYHVVGGLELTSHDKLAQIATRAI